MIILCWNVRGLGNTWTFKALAKVLRLYKPNILFLCETKRNALQMEKIKIKLTFDNWFAVNSRGSIGGLALLWNSNLDLRISYYSMHHIDSLIQSEGDIHWRFTGLYGHSYFTQRHHTWSLLKRLSSNFNLPWLYGGDLKKFWSHRRKKAGSLEMWKLSTLFGRLLNIVS